MNAQPSRTKEGRCVDCENAENKMKDLCYGCKNYFENNFSHFIKSGNVCYDCMRIVNAKHKNKTKVDK